MKSKSNLKEINIQRDGLKKADKSPMINNISKGDLQTNESLMIKAFNRLSEYNFKMKAELRWICRYFVNLWNNDNYYKKLSAELQKVNEIEHLIKIAYPKNNYFFYINIGFDFIDVSVYADSNFSRPAIYSVTLTKFVDNPNRYIKEIKKLLGKKFKEVL